MSFDQQEASAAAPMVPGKLEVMAPRPQFSMVPRDLAEAMKFAEMMAASELVPKHFRNKPGDVLIAMQMGSEVGLAPMAALQNIAVINGKPGLYGDAGKAILLANGCILEEDDIEAIKATGRARCRITRRGRPPVERTFSIENAKTASLWGKEGPWRNYPERQMAWRAFWFAARDAAADLLKGLGGAEELVDMGWAERVPFDSSQPSGRPALPAYTDEALIADLAKVTPLIQSGRKTADQLLATIKSKYTMTAEQEQLFRDAARPETAAALSPEQAAFVDEMGGE